ncbi:MAG TPA: hypothetical protein VE641_17040, partial [Chthoniobacterales bacterium]|nr:hypothetical protein [Chthoniobacterales bacterium]
MRHTGCWALLCVIFAFAAPLGAEVNDNGAAISAALTNGKSSEALALISQAFSALKTDEATEAETLIKSILAVAPIDLSGKVVVAAIEANPSFGEAILSAISDTSETEKLAILNRVSFMASRQPESFNNVSGSLPKMLDSADANVSVSDRLTSPDYNPSNLLSETGVMLSPNRPDVRQDRRELLNDRQNLEIARLKLEIDRLEHKPPAVIEEDRAKIAAIE